MIYVGIDIAKNNHYASIIDSNGVVIQKPFLVTNDYYGFNLLLSKISKYSKEDILLGLESTAHYGNNLIYFFYEKGYKLGLINPIQTAAMRNINIRGAKNDKIDTILIINALKDNRCSLITLEDINKIKLKSLCRERKNLMTNRTACKIKLISYIDQLFPELTTFFKGHLDLNVSLQLLKLYSSPNDISKINLTKLTNIFVSNSRGRYKKEDAIRLKALAKNSVGITNQALPILISQIVYQIELFSNQIEELDKTISSILNEIDNSIATIPGISTITAANIIAELGDISRFSNPNKVLAFAGLDPKVRQSGNFNASTTRMSKRGSRTLRYYLILAAHNVVKNTKTFNDYYTLKISQGKSHYNALGHCAGKLVRIIFKLLQDNSAFNLL